MREVLSDDIGSMPLPSSMEKEGLRKIAADVAVGKASAEEHTYFMKTVSDLMYRKICAGIDRPNFPQIQDMVSSYKHLIEGFYELRNPWVIERRYAVISEVSAVKEYAKTYYSIFQKPLEFRVCVTGPLELYLNMAGYVVEEDLLYNIARSVQRFLRNCIVKDKHVKTVLFSIDEPSLGLNPNIVVSDDVLVKAWDIAAKPAAGLDVEVHLHSPYVLDKFYNTEYVNVLGMEYASNPKAVDYVSKDELEAYDKYLRAGVSRTDCMKMASEYSKIYGEDVYKTKGFSRLVEVMESKDVIFRRLCQVYKLFSDRLKYAGPDCGLGSWPDLEAACMLLKNTAEAVKEFNHSGKIF